MNLKFTRERVLLLGLLGAAGVGLLADQFLFAAEPASTAEEYTLPASPTAHTKGTRGAAVSPERLLAERLRQLRGTSTEPSGAVRDVFGSSTMLRGGNGSSSAATGPWSRRTLTGVIVGTDGKATAIVDGRMLKLGTRLDGMRLVRVNNQMAVFSDGNDEITLQISQKSTAPN